MPEEPQAIEVEVVEIDGLAPAAAPEAEPEAAPRAWRDWQGKVMQLDARWWPLWVLLGAVAVFLMLTLGVVLGVLYAVFAILRGVYRAVTG